MKRILCTIVAVLVLLSSFSVYGAEVPESLKQLVNNEKNKATAFVLTDLNADGTPELVRAAKNKTEVYAQQGEVVVRLAEFSDVSAECFSGLKRYIHIKNGTDLYVARVFDEDSQCIYRMEMREGVPLFSLLGVEYADDTGTFVDENGAQTEVLSVSEKMAQYLSDYVEKPQICTSLFREQDTESSAEDLFARYRFLSELSDDTAEVSLADREKVKQAVAQNAFDHFDFLSVLSESALFVSYYEMQDGAHHYAVVDRNDISADTAVFYTNENLDVAYLDTVKTAETASQNIWFDYTACAAFRGIDDYVNYLVSKLAALGEPLNVNGKSAVIEYIEYAINQCSRTEVKVAGNVAQVTAYNTGFLAENAQMCKERLLRVCADYDILSLREPEAIPEQVIRGGNVKEAVRIAFDDGVFASLGSAAGLRITLDDTHGVYVRKSDLEKLQTDYTSFAVEYRATALGCNVTFTDGKNSVITYIPAPVGFYLPAKSEYSTVMASFTDALENWGGQFDEHRRTIMFFTNYSGSYDISENDVTINDIGDLSPEEARAVRFLVSKGIFTVDKKNNFRPFAPFSRGDLITALVKMFYAIDNAATCSFKDVSEKEPLYRYVASAETAGVISGTEDQLFHPKDAATRETIGTILGRTLAERKGYVRPENPDEILVYNDYEDISPWARGDLALAVQNGLFPAADAFFPENAVTRSEGALLLYKTFMLLYDISPVTIYAEMPQEPSAPPEEVIGTDTQMRMAFCIFFTVFVVFVGYIVRKLYHRQKRRSAQKNDTTRKNQ